MSTSDPFLEHLARLLAAYELGPQQGAQVPAFSPTLESQESILSSLECVANRTWNAEAELEVAKSHVGGRVQGEKEVEEEKVKDEEKVKEEGRAVTLLVPEPASIAENPSSLAAATSMSSDEELKLLKSQIKDVTRVCNAIIVSDLTQSVTVDAHGEMLGLKTTVNTMTSQLSVFASKIEKVTREVGTEGRLGGQAEVGNAQGIWKVITDYTNTMARNLTVQIRGFAQISAACFDGDFTRFLYSNDDGEWDMCRSMISNAVTAVRYCLESKTTALEATELANKDMSELFYDVARVCNAIMTGDLNQSVTANAEGPLLYLKDTVNDMTSRLRHFANEVSRVSLDVGVEGGKADGLAGNFDGGVEVPDAEGVWLEMVRNVNRVCFGYKDLLELNRRN